MRSWRREGTAGFRTCRMSEVPSCPSKCLRDPDNPLIVRKLDAVVYSRHLPHSRYEDVYSFKPAGARANMLAQTGNRKRSSGRRGERTNAGGRDRNYSGPSEEREREHEGATGRQNEQLDPGSYCCLCSCVCVCMEGL
ncbi:hypothetical protein DPX16_10387 [Anabarilius grahami]|uniref:Uncharacterized protein n=1 Tax=Anabarilius grahami TaxID=495550 RepID=A0A3N0Y4V7_ANAGA|nr:hypothetical protein DPX16_10387 [Anabarilius grahami]